MKGIIFNLQKMSVHDGPGIRTTVFLKGCPLNCLWCSNPESQRVQKEIACFASRCIHCGYCAEICPEGVIEKGNNFNIADRVSCTVCSKCVDECCTNSKQVIGKEYGIEDLYEEILKDKSFYDSSGGGVTFSGGEPMMQPDFLIEILKKCKEGGIGTAIETTGYGDTDKLIEASKYLDLIYYDLKHMNCAEHERLTGVSNNLILDNLKCLSEVHSNIIVRIPVIPGLNDSEENIKLTADYIASLSVKTLELLPYHKLGENKYGQLGRQYALGDIEPPSDEHMNSLANIAINAIGERNSSVNVMPSF